MTLLARANLPSVTIFRKTIEKTFTLTAKFSRASSNFSEIRYSLDDLENRLKEDIPEMETAKEKLEYRIEEIKEKIAELERQKKEISKAEEQMEINGELIEYRRILQSAENLRSEVLSHIELICRIASSIEQKKYDCQRFIDNLAEIESIAARKSAVAVNNLKEIEKTIARYLQIKMQYEETVVRTGTHAGNTERFAGYTEAEVKQYHIKFNEENHVCEFDGRKYGGKYNAYKERIDKTPRDDNPMRGHYEGMRGESKYIPSDRTAEGILVIKILEKYGQDGITYRNGEPDFEVCSEAVVTIPDMSENRSDYIDQAGMRHEGNFSQADTALCERWNAEKKDGRSDWIPRDVYDYRHAEGLTWHEKCDMETIVLVPTEVNTFFTHLGGCSECRVRDKGNNDGGFDDL